MRLSTLNLCFVIGSIFVLSSCKKTPIKDNTNKGPEVQVGNGQARTFVTINQKAVPQEIGVMVTDEALSGLPTEDVLYTLELPQKAIGATPFNHVVLGLSAHGHPLPPSGSIGPHFDVRFFMMTKEEREAIPAPATSGYPAGGGFDVSPPAGYLPNNYVMNSAKAKVGRHWSQSITTPDTTVNYTMAYGTWNGAFTFLAANVTLATVQNGTNISVPYPQPQYFAKHGYYPTKYNVYKDDKGNHIINLSDFVWQ